MAIIACPVRAPFLSHHHVKETDSHLAMIVYVVTSRITGAHEDMVTIRVTDMRNNKFFTLLAHKEHYQNRIEELLNFLQATLAQ